MPNIHLSFETILMELEPPDVYTYIYVFQFFVLSQLHNGIFSVLFLYSGVSGAEGMILLFSVGWIIA